MSFRDLRNFTEMMRALGYNRLISMENFRTPNFSLVAEILIWLVGRFDPDVTDIHTSYATQKDRVKLIRSTAQLLALKANMMLNTKRLYQADGFAVKELLKVVTRLYKAVQILEEDSGSVTTDKLRRWQTNQWGDISSRIQELKMSRELASQVVSKGALLYELLGKEVELREVRSSSMNSQLELSTIENGLREAIASTRQNVANVNSLIKNVTATEISLDSKIEKKKTELDRSQKRLQTLKKVRPAFLEEFENLEVELQLLYEDYITRVRCHTYVEQVQEDLALQEQNKMMQRQKATRKLMEDLQLEDAQRLMLDDGEEVDEGGDTLPKAQLQGKPTPGDVRNKQTAQKTRRLRTATASRARLTTGKKRVFGGMDAGDNEDEDEDDSAGEENGMYTGRSHVLDSSSDSSLLIDEYDGELNSEQLMLPNEEDSLPNQRTNQAQFTDDDDDF